MAANLENLGGRKFIMALVALIAGTVVQVKGGGVSTEFTALLIGIVGVFSGANAMVTAKMGGAAPSTKEEGEAPSATDSAGALEGRVAQLEATMETAAQNIAQIQQYLSAVNQMQR